MRSTVHFSIVIGTFFSLWASFCESQIISLSSDEISSENIQKAIINLNPKDTLIFPEGVIHLDKNITFITNDIKIMGQGADKTILDFKSVSEGAQAVFIRSSNVTLSNLSIRNSPGDGIVARGVKNITVHNTKVYWQKGIQPGGYGIYPVQCQNVEIFNNITLGANEAGIYIGQTINGVIRNNRSELNVVGIDIENSSNIQVINNTSSGNSIGIAINGRPYLIVLNPKNILVTKNLITNNNLANFATPSSFAHSLGSGKGIKVVATDQINITDNTIQNHDTSDIDINHFAALNRPYKGDAMFDSKTENVVIGAKQFSKQGVIITQDLQAHRSVPKNNGKAIIHINPTGSTINNHTVACIDIKNMDTHYKRQLSHYACEQKSQ